MSDLSSSSVPASQPQESEEVHNQQQQQIIRRFQQIPRSPNRKRPIDLSVLFSCITNRPFSICLTSRGVEMDRRNNNISPFPFKLNPNYCGATVAQDQSGPQHQQQQYGQNQYGGQQPHQYQGSSQGHNPQVNHYHGSNYNFVFMNSGAYNLSIQTSGLNSEMPYNQQFQHTIPNQGGRFHSQGYGDNRYEMQQSNNTGQYPGATSQPYQQQQRFNAQNWNWNGPITTPGTGYSNGLGFGSGQGSGNELALQPLRRSHSTNTLLSQEEELPDELFMFGSQQR